jgi:hypothetical protein
VIKWLNDKNGGVLCSSDLDTKRTVFELGDLVTMLGKLTNYRGECEITAERARRNLSLSISSCLEPAMHFRLGNGPQFRAPPLG